MNLTKEEKADRYKGHEKARRYFGGRGMIKTYNADCIDYFGGRDFLADIAGRNVCIITDPPFNIGYHYTSYKDNMPDDKYYAWLEKVFAGFPFVVVHYPEAIYKIAFQLGRFPERIVSWVYNSNTAKQHRDIAFFGVSPDFKQVCQPYKNPNDKRVKRLIERGKMGGASIRLVER